MKTTIELKGYTIVIDENEEGVTVMGMKDGETVEEFTLETEMGEDDEMFGQEEEEEDFEDADDYEDDMDELGEDDEMEGDDMEDMDDEDMDDEDMDDMQEDEKVVSPESPKLESFSSFISRSSKPATRKNRR